MLTIEINKAGTLFGFPLYTSASIPEGTCILLSHKDYKRYQDNILNNFSGLSSYPWGQKVLTVEEALQYLKDNKVI